NIERDIRNEMYSHIQRLSYRFFDNTKTGRLLTRLTNDLMNVGEMAHHGPEDLFIALITLLGAFSLMLSINAERAVVSFVIVPVILVLAIYFKQKRPRARRELFGRVSEFNHLSGGKGGGIRLGQASAYEDRALQAVTAISEASRKTKLTGYK